MCKALNMGAVQNFSRVLLYAIRITLIEAEQESQRPPQDLMSNNLFPLN